MHTEHHIAVLAGTPVDTQMGVDCLARAGLAGLAGWCRLSGMGALVLGCTHCP